MIVYLNGEFLPQEEARISPTDRGFLFGDGIYEAIPFYEGQPFALGMHWKRLQNGLSFLRIRNYTESHEEFLETCRTLLTKNQLDKVQRTMIYVQITRGATPNRNHAFPTSPPPCTVYAFCKEIVYPSPERWSKGYSAALIADERWGRVDIKTINLLPNVLAFQDAKEKGVDEAILHKNGIAMEGSHTNLFVILQQQLQQQQKVASGREEQEKMKTNGTKNNNATTTTILVTHPTTNEILPGITRAIVLEEARRRSIGSSAAAAADDDDDYADLDLVVEERPITLEELFGAKEVFLTSTTSEIKPVVSIDGKPIGGCGGGDGDNGYGTTVGPITRTLWHLFARRIQDETGVRVPSVVDL